MRLTFLTLALLVACGPSGKGTTTGPGKAGPRTVTEAGRLFPVSARLPGKVTYVVVGARLADVVELVNDTWHAIGVADRSLAREEDGMRRELGLWPLSAGDLAAAGFAVDRNAALYSTGLFPTLVLPVADPVKVKRLIDGFAERTTVVVSEHRGTSPVVFVDGSVRLSAVIVDDWLLLHVSDKNVEPEALAWLDELLDAPGAKLALDTEPDFQWALEHGQGHRGVLGLLRTGDLWTVLRAVDRQLAGAGRKEEGGCAERDRQLTTTLGRAVLAATAVDRKLDATFMLELSPAAVLATRAALAPAPEPGYLSVRATAPLHASWALDLDWLGQQVRPFANAPCGEVTSELVEELWFEDPSDRMVSSYHAGLLGGGISGLSVELRAVGWFGIVDERRLVGHLDEILPGRKKITVNDTAAEEYDLGDYRIADPIRLARRDGALRVGLGRGLLEQLLGGAGAAADTRQTFEMGVFLLDVDRLSDLASAAGMLASATGEDDVAEIISWLQAVLHQARAELVLEADGVRMAGGYLLR